MRPASHVSGLVVSVVDVPDAGAGAVVWGAFPEVLQVSRRVVAVNRHRAAAGRGGEIEAALGIAERVALATHQGAGLVIRVSNGRRGVGVSFGSDPVQSVVGVGGGNLARVRAPADGLGISTAQRTPGSRVIEAQRPRFRGGGLRFGATGRRRCKFESDCPDPPPVGYPAYRNGSTSPASGCRRSRVRRLRLFCPWVTWPVVSKYDVVERYVVPLTHCCTSVGLPRTVLLVP